MSCGNFQRGDLVRVGWQYGIVLGAKEDTVSVYLSGPKGYKAVCSIDRVEAIELRHPGPWPATEDLIPVANQSWHQSFLEVLLDPIFIGDKTYPVF